MQIRDLDAFGRLLGGCVYEMEGERVVIPSFSYFSSSFFSSSCGGYDLDSGDSLPWGGLSKLSTGKVGRPESLI